MGVERLLTAGSLTECDEKAKQVLIGNCPIRRRRKEARPSEIIEAARSAFVANGFALTRVEDIAAQAGVSKGTVYLYFPTKEALFEAVARASVVPVLDSLAEALRADTSSSAPAQLRLMCETMYREMVGTEQRRLVHMVIAEGPRFPWLTEFYHREILSKGRNILRTILRRGAARGEFTLHGLDDNPEVIIAPALIAALWKILFDHLEPMDLAAYRETHLSAMLRALEAPQAS